MATRDGRGTTGTGTGTARSVAEATRFTSNTPHASTKPATASYPAASAMPSAQATGGPMNASRPAPSAPRPLPSAAAATHRPETLDEKVRRLRAAHLAAKNHDVSRLDRVLGASRRYLDAAHRFTVMGLIGFSGTSGPHRPPSPFAPPLLIVPQASRWSSAPMPPST